MSPKVSIIIPLYNSEEYINQAIDSCINQTYTNIEIIVIDDGSTDNSKSCLEDYIKENKIKYFYQDNRERSAARNYGLDVSTGDYICFLDSDDLLHRDKVQKQVELLEKNQSIFATYSAVEYVHAKSNEFIFILGRNYKGDTIIDDLIMGNFIPIQSILCRRSDIRFNEIINVVEDWDYLINILFEKNVYCSKEVLSVVRVDNQLSKRYISKIVKGEIHVLIKLLRDTRFRNKKLLLVTALMKRVIKYLALILYKPKFFIN